MHIYCKTISLRWLQSGVVKALLDKTAVVAKADVSTERIIAHSTII
jgi:hypothetical protein